MSSERKEDDISPPDGGHADRAPRASVFLRATVERFGHGGTTTHRVRDLSRGGVRIDQARDLRKGATVLVTVGALSSVGATVAWVKDDWAGLAFAHAVDPDLARAGAAISPKGRR